MGKILQFSDFKKISFKVRKNKSIKQYEKDMEATI